MSELLPCPFCGSEAESSIAYTASMISCKNEKCIMIGCLIDNEPWVDEIEKKWNESHVNKEIQKRDELLEQAKLHVQFLSIASGIGVYEQWLKQYEELKR